MTTQTTGGGGGGGGGGGWVGTLWSHPLEMYLPSKFFDCSASISRDIGI